MGYAAVLGKDLSVGMPGSPFALRLEHYMASTVEVVARGIGIDSPDSTVAAGKGVNRNHYVPAVHWRGALLVGPAVAKAGAANSLLILSGGC